MTDEPEITVQKIGQYMMVSEEVIYGTYITPTTFCFGTSEHTDEQRAEWTRKAEERKQRAAEYAAKIDAISDPFARAVLDLHARKARYSNDDWQVCEGCDMDGYEAEEPGCVAAADAWDREHCGCGHSWEYHGPEVPGCCECKCRNIRRATAVRIVEDDDFDWDEPREPRPVPRSTQKGDDA